MYTLMKWLKGFESRTLDKYVHYLFSFEYFRYKNFINKLLITVRIYFLILRKI